MSGVLLTRRVRFEAAHRLWSERLSDEENIATYGKCARVGGHGHNYEVEVTVAGPVDAATGMIVERGELDRILASELLDRCDHRNLDEVIGPAVVSTGENLARIFFDWVAPHVPRPARLTRLRVYETPRNIFDAYAREDS